MRTSQLSVALIFLVALEEALSAAVPRVAHNNASETSQCVVVKLKGKVSKAEHLKTSASHFMNSNITYDYDSDFFNGYAGTFDLAALSFLATSVEVDAFYGPAPLEPDAITTQNDAPWGIARLSQDNTLADQNSSHLTFQYSYNSLAGDGVDIYVIDTGIYTQHEDFGQRARWGKTFAGTDGVDITGHGTHVAGIAAGRQFGVAKAANLIAVKVYEGNETYDCPPDIIAGMQYVFQEAKKANRPSIAQMSLAVSVEGRDFLPYPPVDDCVASLTNAGIHVVASAGNKRRDATTQSPANAPSAIVVGATDIDDRPFHGTNYGPRVDIFAPGVKIMSAGITSPNATATKTGTSMAAPHVSGLVAYFISVLGNLSPDAMSDYIANISNRGHIQQFSNEIVTDTVNYLARNDVHKLITSDS